MKSMHLVGYVRPIPDICSFVVPVFSSKGSYFVQTIAEDTIVGWRVFCIDSESALEKNKVKISGVLGSPAIYAFETSEGVFLCGTYRDIHERLIDIGSNERTHPAIQKEIIWFRIENRNYFEKRSQAIYAQKRAVMDKIRKDHAVEDEVSRSSGYTSGNKIYVGNLPMSFSDEDLAQAFSSHGTVVSAKVMMARDTGRSKGFGFVEMSSDAEAREAIRCVNGKQYGNKRLVISSAHPIEAPFSRAGGFGRQGGGSANS